MTSLIKHSYYMYYTCISLFILLHAFCIAYWYPGSLSKFGSVDNSGNDIHQTVTLTCHISTHLIWNCPVEQYIYFRLDPWKFRFLQTYPPSPFLKIKREVLQREVCNPTTVRCIHWQPIITRLKTRSYTYRKSLVLLDSKEKQESI